nr:immunoglobulin heavy chain junction region [Macaca mulatta]MOW46219.1 immunoglobulin heavy chain junction region [Macaca mulatta]MOW46263.1 immunoglobulin heavy chain junction region [Macaca mulatta]MOW46869.1 immunoglobulin heavy chain junction region [Macaca mulatta]MOW46993.1 immunoglobulin heavy chain junction region [Macaca mulatta]
CARVSGEEDTVTTLDSW